LTLVLNENEPLPLYISAAPDAPPPETKMSIPKQQRSRAHEAKTAIMRCHPAFLRKVEKESKYDEPPDIDDYVMIDRSGEDHLITVSLTEVNLLPGRLMYLRGDTLKKFSDPPLLEFLDVSMGINAAWKQIPTNGVTTQGITINVSALPPGNYPYIIPHGNKSSPYRMTIALTGIVFDSTSTPPSRELLAKQLLDSPQARLRQFKLDVFDGMVSSTNTVGQTTQYVRNDLNQEIKKTDTSTLAVGPDGSRIPNFQGVTVTHRNVDGAVIGITQPLNNSEAYVLNPQNKKIQYVQADGTIMLTAALDGFGRAIWLTDSRGQATRRVFDPADNLIQQIVPNNDPSNNSGQPLITTYGFNEKRQRCLKRDPARNSTYMNYNITGDIESRINPLQDTTRTVWDGRNHVKLLEITAGGNTQSWYLASIQGYFGIVDRYYDLSSAQYQYGYDYKLQQILSASEGGKHGQYAQMISRIDPRSWLTIYRLDTSQLTPGQNLQFNYIAGRLMQVDDQAQGLRTYYDYDAEDRRILMEIYSSADNTLLRRTTALFDSLGRQSNFFDTMLTGITEYDGNSNRRHRITRLYNPQTNTSPPDDSWYLYDVNNRPTAVNCAFDTQNNRIVPTRQDSFLIEYSQGVRSKETDYLGRPRYIAYWANGDISQFIDTDGTRHDFSYHASGYQSAAIKTYTSGKVEKSLVVCNQDLFQTQETSITNNKTMSVTNLTPNANNDVAYQETKDNSSDIQVEYKLTFDRIGMESEFELVKVHGNTSDKFGQEYTQSSLFYNPNKILCAKLGAEGQDNNAVYFRSTYDGIIFQRIKFPLIYLKNSINSYDYYFFDINNDFLSSFSMNSVAVTRRIGNFSSVKNHGFWGRINFNMQPTALSISNSRVDGMSARPQPIVPNRIKATDMSKSTDAHHITTDSEYVQSINYIDILTVPGKYTVKPGDTFASIACLSGRVACNNLIFILP
jgi:hypothetical protein